MSNSLYDQKLPGDSRLPYLQFDIASDIVKSEKSVAPESVNFLKFKPIMLLSAQEVIRWKFPGLIDHQDMLYSQGKPQFAKHWQIRSTKYE